MNKLEVINLFEKCFAFYPTTRFEPSQEIIDTWHSALNDIPTELVVYNLSMHVKKSNFFPTIADLIKPMEKLSYHEIGKQTLLEYTKEVKENKERAVPCPPEIKEELRIFFSKGD